MSDRIGEQLKFIEELDGLKNVQRQTLIMDGSRRENTAEHSWHVAVLGMVLVEYASEPIKTDRMIQILLLHDVVEVYAGDTFVYDMAAASQQAVKEAEAAGKLFAHLPKDQAVKFKNLWQEYEDQKTPEARFAKAMDRFMPVFHNARTGGHSWKKHGVKRAQVLERNRLWQPIAPNLFDFLEKLVDEAVKRGELSP